MWDHRAKINAEIDARDQQIVEAVRERMAERKMKTRGAAKQIGIPEDEFGRLIDAGNMNHISAPLSKRDPIRKKLLAWLG